MEYGHGPEHGAGVRLKLSGFLVVIYTSYQYTSLDSYEMTSAGVECWKGTKEKKLTVPVITSLFLFSPLYCLVSRDPWIPTEEKC